MTFSVGEEFAVQMSKLAAGSEEIARKAIYAGAGIVADEVKRRLEGVVSPKATGDLVESLGIAPIQRDKDGGLNAKIGFDGYDRKGTPNQLKARALESGTSTQRKRPFVRPAVNAVKKTVQAEMERVAEEEMRKITG